MFVVYLISRSASERSHGCERLLLLRMDGRVDGCPADLQCSRESSV